MYTRPRLLTVALPAVMLLSLLLGIAWLRAGQTSGIDPAMRRYEERREQLFRLVDGPGTRAALDALHDTAVDPVLGGLCHGLAHEVGRRSFEQYGYEKALQFEDDICGSGYLHGVIESRFADLSDPLVALDGSCSPTDGRCFHGLGHGLMYALRNDLPRSLDFCSSLPVGFQRIQCAEGVFMENASTDPVAHPSRYLSADDPFVPCDTQKDPYRGVCAFYAPRRFLALYPRSYDAAIAWCRTVHEQARDACVKGVGSAAMKQNITEPSVAIAACATAGDRRTYCIQGLVSYAIVHFASVERGRELCAAMAETDRPACLAVAAQSEQFYPD